MHSETFLSRTHGEISKKNVLPEKLLVQRSHGISDNKNIREKIETLRTAAWKEKTPETSYREMNTNLRFAVERSLLQIDSYGHHVYDWTHRRISQNPESQILIF